MDASVPQTSPDTGVRTQERRRYPRVDPDWKVMLESEDGTRWRGKTIAFNQFGVKVVLETGQAGPPSGTVLRLQVEVRHGEPPMSLKGIVWRLDGQDPVVVFSNLTTDEFRHLRELTDSFLRGAILGEPQA